MITSIRGSIHQGHETFSENSRGQQCAFFSLASSDLVYSWTQTNIDDILQCMPWISHERYNETGGFVLGIR